MLEEISKKNENLKVKTTTTTTKNIGDNNVDSEDPLHFSRIFVEIGKTRVARVR